jgi:hypothetical protein
MIEHNHVFDHWDPERRAYVCECGATWTERAMEAQAPAMTGALRARIDGQEQALTQLWKLIHKAEDNVKALRPGMAAHDESFRLQGLRDAAGCFSTAPRPEERADAPKEPTRDGRGRVPLVKPLANEGSWDDACAGCGYLPQHCECDR